MAQSDTPPTHIYSIAVKARQIDECLHCVSIASHLFRW